MLNELLIKELSEQVGNNTSEIQSMKDAEIYSTDEVKTNKKYNNEPIYRRIIKIRSTNTTGQAIKLIETPYIKELITCSYRVDAGNLYYINCDNVYLFYNYIEKCFLESHTESWWSNREITIIAEYTKNN